ncbi:MAG: sigma-54-dependent transcriptional regulator [Myxococcota bacterium]
MTRILIVDDEEGIRRSLEGILEDEGFATATASDGEEAIGWIEEQGEPDLVLLDIAMPGRDGVEILVELSERFPQLPVVMMSGHGTIETAVRTTRHGAYDFVEKPLSIDKLLLTLQHALEQADLKRENARLRAQSLRAHEILGDSDAVTKLKEQIRMAAPSNGWVLITGDNGTGKELVARQIHCQSKRADQPFIEVNCAAIPEELIESELFGHEKGAFTGAVAQKIGRFELAHGGTLFLDEVGDMSLMTQAKVLRILQEQSFVRVGGTEQHAVDVRVIAATNKDLTREIAEGRFREDLYYRLNVIPFHVPPLRERPEDVEVLARTFAEEFCREAGVPPKKITAAALKLLAGYSWPGNVRELRNLMERTVIMSRGTSIGVRDLPDTLRASASSESGETLSLDEARKSFEREYLLARLAEHGWNISRTAEAIGLARESLSRKIKAHEIEVERG